MSATYPEREPDQLAGVPLPEYQGGVVGHAAALEALSARLDAGRLPGGILIHGPRGIGKATLAFDFARRIFARTGDESPAHIAAQVAAGAYPNLFVMRKSARDTGKGYYTVIRVEEVRGFIDQMRMTRGRAGSLMVMMSNPAGILVRSTYTYGRDSSCSSSMSDELYGPVASSGR